MIPHLKTVREVVPAAEFRRLAGVGAALIVASLLEVLGTGMVLPFLASVTNPAFLDRYPIFEQARAALGLSGDDDFFLATAVALVIIMIAKTVIGYFANAWAASFKGYAQHRLSVDIFQRHLVSRYGYTVEVNSAELLNLLRHTVGHVYGGFLVPLVSTIADALLIVLLLAMIVYAEPGASVAAAVLVTIPAALVYQYTKRKNRTLGAERERYSIASIKALQEGIAALKELVVLGRHQSAVERYRLNDRRFMDAHVKSARLNQLPRVVLEIAVMAAIVVFILVSTKSGRSPAEMLPTLGLVAAAALRMMPAALRLVNTFNALQFSAPGIELVRDMVRAQFENALPESVMSADDHVVMKAAFDHLLLDDISFHYGRDSAWGLNGLTLRIEQGEAVGLIGPSGAGKSTLVDILMGLQHPQQGHIFLNGIPLNAGDAGWRGRLGYVSQTVFLIDDSIRRNVALGVADDEIDDDAVLRALSDAQLDAFVEAQEQGMDTVVGELGARLSGGQRQRIMIARALYHNPEILILDEATSALDQAVEAEILETLAALKGKKTLIVITHRPSALAFCDRVLEIDNGRLRIASTAGNVNRKHAWPPINS